ncbi:IclR family transcriptional regulator [Sphingomonas sp. Root710]|uniref:IclR family transcriptional regulator n=1 Tax=Sphingomonas sp. Root710 TaxID=1736594 RepID=UPI000A516A6A|nr:IclR family transcriptional regulator [Sphingomonas sp. Root710]
MSTADRLLTMLDLFTLDRPDWSVDEAAEAVGMPTSTVYRYFNSLSRSGLVATVGGGRYILGPSIIRYDRQLRLTDPLVRSARGEMDRLAATVEGKGVVFLCRLFGDQVMCVSRASVGNTPFTISYERGRLMPLFAGSASRVILANLPTAKINALYRKYAEKFEQHGLGNTLPAVRETLKVVRNDNCFVTVGEVDPGMRGISVPVMASGKILGSLTVAGPRQGFTQPQIARVLEQLHEAAQRTVEELHHWISHTATAVRNS